MARCTPNICLLQCCLKWGHDHKGLAVQRFRADFYESWNTIRIPEYLRIIKWKSPKLLLKKRNRYMLTQGKNWRCSDDGEPGLVLSVPEVMQMAQCVWIRGEFIAQLFDFSLVSLHPQPCCKHRILGLCRSWSFTPDSEDVGNHRCVRQDVFACLQRAHAVSEAASFSSVRNWHFYSLIFVLFFI